MPPIRQRPRLDVPELVDDGLGVDHVGGECLVPGDPILARAGIHAGQHFDPAVVLGLPPAIVVELQLVGLDAVEGGLKLCPVCLIVITR